MSLTKPKHVRNLSYCIFWMFYFLSYQDLKSFNQIWQKKFEICHLQEMKWLKQIIHPIEITYMLILYGMHRKIITQWESIIFFWWIIRYISFRPHSFLVGRLKVFVPKSHPFQTMINHYNRIDRLLKKFLETSLWLLEYIMCEKFLP